jgi:hypothetical protein
MVAADHDGGGQLSGRHHLVEFNPARWRSPYPSQQMREGSPWNATFSPGVVIHRVRCLLSGNRSRIARSVVAMSFGSPDSAAHRNGPSPS